MSELKNWYVQKKKDLYIAWGNVYDNPRYEEGRWIHTSLIRKIEADQNVLKISTANTIYECQMENYLPIADETMQACLHDYMWPDDEDAWLALQKHVKQNMQKETALLTSDQCDACSVLSFSSSIQKGFCRLELKNKKNTEIIISYDVHTGMFQDDVEISDIRKGYYFRYFPFHRNAFQFEEWKTKYLPVFMKNIGNETIYVSCVYGDFAIEAGHECLLAPDNVMDRIFTGNQKETDETRVISHGSMRLKI